MRKYLLLLLLITFAFKSYLQAQTLYPITEGLNLAVSENCGFLKLREHLYIFTAGNSNTGNEPYVTDGTQLGTHLLQDINPGTEGSGAYNFHRINDTVCIFAANDGVNNHGTELWRSNGTSNGTYMVADLAPGVASSMINISTVQLDGKNFFADKQDSVTTLYITDGSATGTTSLLTVDQWNNLNISNSATTNEIMYFYIHIDGDAHLWRTDGTVNGTFELIDENSTWSPPKGATIGTSFIFSASDSTHGTELWITDGTITGTTLLKDIVPGTGSSSPSNFTLVNGKQIFQAKNDTLQFNLWVTDGTDTATFKLEDSTLVSSYGYYMFSTSDSLIYFSQGYKLWKTDGTVTGTSWVHNFSSSDGFISSGGANPVVEEFGLKFFVLKDLLDYASIWATDGTDSGTFKVYDDPISTTHPIEQLTQACGEIFCRVSIWGVDYSIWKVEQDTAYDLNISPQFFIPNYLRIYLVDDGAIYFTCLDSMWIEQLYKLQVCSATATQNLSDDNSLSLFPNPNDGLFTIELPDDLSNAEVRVNDMMGKNVYSTKTDFNERLNLDLQNIPAGVYMVQIISDGKRSQQIFIKQ